ncbi:cytochrome b-c1 complex subunit 6 family protein [Ascoidea rubescens DSM 1968]|uniref:Cytochrome b-c1 complex subunit 6, mitochondrial n=1 Tax=Ascoidea rubescens DSM 1968 TaxID=1344418 RepID=A0A1D2VB47_9ASCO|nr:Non-heme 11 kDa protein of cytochrome bc1 complex [Ascoidea rubescens DSM 1968]ODV58831.1 Non-heme 11 kDa protein of cytochrome bc1 complex [Ascoidea rubescens DSM 1968]
MEFLKDLLESMLPTAYAEEEEEEEVEEASEEAEEEEEEDEDDEDEEEAQDQFDTLRSKCSETASCKPLLHHYHECVERVTKEMEEEDYDQKDYKEDCIEEFFHLHHCLNDCAAPRLFYKLK